MADDPLNVQHNIRLQYEEQIKSSLLPHFAALQKQLAQITNAFKKHRKGVGGIGSAAKSTIKINKAFGKSSSMAAAQMGGMSKMAFGAGKALGHVGIAVIAATKTFGFMYAAIKKISESQAVFAEFAAQTGKGSEAVFALKNAYVDLSKVTGGAAISVRGLTAAMTDFASVGFPQQLMASSDAATEAVGKLEDILVRSVGAESARKMASSVFHGALKDNLPVLNSLIYSLQKAGTEGRSMEEDIGNIAREFAAFDEVSFRGIMGAMQTLKDQTQGTADGGIAAFTKWEQLTGKLGSLFVQLKQNLIDAFGADLASLLDTASKKMTEWVGDVDNWLNTIKDWYVGVKVIVHNYAEVWKSAWYGIKGLGQIAFADLTWAAAKFGSFVTLGFSESAKSMEKWAAKTKKAGKEAFNVSINPNILIVEDQILLAQRERESLTRKQASATQKVLTPLAALLSEQTKIRDQLTGTILPGVTSWTEALKNAASATQSLGDLTALTGANYKVMGERIGDFTREIGQTQLKMARELLDASSSEKLLATLQLIRNINKEIAMEGETPARKQKLSDAMKKQSGILAGQVEAYKTLQQYLKDYTADIDANLRLVGKARDIAQSQLQITQAVYGTPALAVKAQLAIVKTMEREKTLLKSRLVSIKEAMENMTQQDIEAGKLQLSQEALLDTQKELTDKTAEQLNMVKSLRDGYLDAVTAMSFGAGRFSKILITQEKNLMRGLQKGVAKRNYLLGQFGEAAGAAQAEAFRFSAQGMGQIETMAGKMMSSADIAKQQEARIAGVDERQAGPAREATQIMLGIVSAADKNNYDMIQSYAKGTDRVVSAIDRLASEGSMRAAEAAGLQGRAGDTARGEAMRRTGEDLPPTEVGFPETDRNTDALQKQRKQLEEQIKLTKETIRTWKEVGLSQEDLQLAVNKLAGLQSKSAKIRPLESKEQYLIRTDKLGASEASQTAMLKSLTKQEKLLEQGAASAKKGLVEDIDKPKIPEKPDGVLSNLDVSAANTFYGSAIGYYKTFVDLLSKIAKEKKIVVVPGATGATGATGGDKVTLPSGALGLHQDGTEADRTAVRNLRKTDREVKKHERAHKSAAGPFSIGQPEYTYEEGPDGKRYAVGGQVMVDLSPIPGDPEGTIEKMERVRKAALAPLHPSEQDEKVATIASMIEDKMRGSLLSQKVVRRKKPRSKVKQKKGKGEAQSLSFSGYQKPETGSSTQDDYILESKPGLVLSQQGPEVTVTVSQTEKELIEVIETLTISIDALSRDIHPGVATPGSTSIADHPSLSESQPGVAESGGSVAGVAGIGGSDIAIAGGVAGITAVAANQTIKAMGTVVKVPIKAVATVTKVGTRAITGTAKLGTKAVVEVAKLSGKTVLAAADLTQMFGRFAAPSISTPALAASTAGAGAAAAGSVYTAIKSIQTVMDERKSLHAQEASTQDNRLFDIAARNSKSTDALVKLTAKRQGIDAQLSAMATGWGVRPEGFFADLSRELGFMAGKKTSGTASALSRTTPHTAGLSTIDSSSPFEESESQERQFENLSSYRREIQDKIDLFSRTAKRREVTESRNLMRPYMEDIDASLQKMLDANLQVGSAGPDEKAELQIQLGELEGKVALQVETVIAKFGDMGRRALEGTVTSQAGKEIIAYEKQIESLRTLKGTGIASPDVLKNADVDIAGLQTKINDLLVDFGQDSIASVHPEIDAIVKKEQAQADWTSIKGFGQKIASSVSSAVSSIVEQTSQSATSQLESDLAPTSPIDRRLAKLQKSQDNLRKRKEEREDNLDAYFYRMGLEGDQIGQILREAFGTREKPKKKRSLPDSADTSGVLHAPELPSEGILTAIDSPIPSPDKSLEDVLMETFKDLPESQRKARSDYVKRQLSKEKQIDSRMAKVRQKISQTKDKGVSDSVKSHAAMMGFRPGQQERVTNLHGFGIPDLGAKTNRKPPTLKPPPDIGNLEMTGPPDFHEPAPAGPLEISEPKVSTIAEKTSAATTATGARSSNTIGKGGGNMQSKMRIVTQILMEMAGEIDRLNEDQNNITEYASNRGLNINPVN